MATNNDLLILAKAAGFFSPKLKIVSPVADFVVLGYSGYKNIFDCEIFDPEKNNNQFVKVFHFVLLHGSFQYLAENEAEYKVDGAHEFFRSDFMTIQENIINIAIQLAKYLSEDNNDL